MFDDIPARAWLLIAFAAVAIGPTKYIWTYIAHSPSRRDITKPPEDLGWRSSGLLVRNLIILTILLALSVFIFTPAAERFAKSPSFLPILMIGVGAWALFTIPKGIATGHIQPFIRGINNTYERDAQPKRFWASMAWNAALGCMCLWLAFETHQETGTDTCHNDQSYYSSQQALAACNEMIGKRNKSGDELAELVAARGIAYHRLNDHRHAMIDYTNAIRLNPRDSYSHYNRGLIYEKLGDRQRAVTDYGAAIRLRPDDADAYLNRGLIYLDSGKLDEAVADFTRAHEIRPKDIWPIANRGITFAWKKDRTRAQADFRAARAIDPSNLVLLRGEALLSMQAGDLKSAVQYLTRAIEKEPDDAWSLRMRAQAYGLLGETEKWEADSDALWRLRKDAE